MKMELAGRHDSHALAISQKTIDDHGPFQLTPSSDRDENWRVWSSPDRYDTFETPKMREANNLTRHRLT